MRARAAAALHGERCSKSRSGLQAKLLSEKVLGGSGVLTESLGRPELYRRRDHGEDGGAAETERGVREVLGSSGALDCTGRRAMPLRSKTWGQIGPIRTGGE